MSAKSAARILVVDDDKSICELITSSLALEGYSVDGVLGSAEALNLLENHEYDLIISDIYLDELTGIDLLRRFQRDHPETRLILITAHATVETAVSAVEEGAFDYLSKPFELDDLFRIVRRALEPAESERKPHDDPGDTASLSSMIIGRSAAMAEVYKRIARVTATDSSVWISGESGTGKELVAQAIHKYSKRKNKPFIAVNCGALAEALLESELFGHIRGAFTGASADRAGLFESAAGGTLFLDEITETEPAFQVKLLRLLQEGEYRPVGTNAARKADVRILAASNQDAEALIKAGKFREDLYYRLAAFTVNLPPLRRRAEDIPLLAAHFLNRLAQRLGRRLAIDPAALNILSSCEWPGNVRQLSNALEKIAILSPDGRIQAQDAENWMKGTGRAQDIGNTPQQTLSQMEKERISQVLVQSQGNKTRAAALLGIDRSTLHRKMQAYGLSPVPAGENTADPEGE